MSSAAGKGRVIQARKVKATSLTKARRTAFLNMLARTCNVRMAAAHIGCTPSAVYRLRDRDAGFAERWREALTKGYQTLEEALLRQALHGLNGGEIERGEAVIGTGGSGTDAAEDMELPAWSPPGTGLTRKLSAGDIQLALALLNRHRASVEGRRGPSGKRRRATQAETDAALSKKLDALARKLGNDH